ncbi:MAG: preprotein translocase subunit SecE [Polyangiaceae bacterium]
MADLDDKTETAEGEADEGLAEPSPLARSEEQPEQDVAAAAPLGATRYVMAGFFTVGIAAAFVLGKMMTAIWNLLAEKAWFQTSLAVLARVSEEERAELCTTIGGAIALFTTIYVYRRPDVKQWSEEVASELSKVTWPDKAEVTNSTVVVLVTSAFATVYLALLDRFWGFVTNLVYGS